jgi:hypothetical protein
MKIYNIPFNHPIIFGNEGEYVSRSVKNSHISDDGLFTRKVNDLPVPSPARVGCLSKPIREKEFLFGESLFVVATKS